MALPTRIKPKRCPSCRKKMSVVGMRTTDDGPVYACPFCLTLSCRGKLKIPDTPIWRGEPGKDPRKPGDPLDSW